MPSEAQARITINHIVHELRGGAGRGGLQMEAVRALLPRFEAKIQRVLDRVWGAATA